MTIHRHPDWYTVVRENWHRTTGFLLASREPCITIRDKEIESVKGRALFGRDGADLAAWQPPDSWILGVIVCPDDTIDNVVVWAKHHKADPGRIWFYLHTRTSHKVLRPWEEAGFFADQVDRVSTWQGLQKLFGLALNDQVYKDWKHRPGEG